MRNSIFFLAFVFLGFVMVSCDKDELSDTNEVFIPIDSIYFSCKIDSETIVLQSPSTMTVSESSFINRLKKNTHSAADSAICGKEFQYMTDDYIITVGFCKSYLIDTMLVQSSSVYKIFSDLNIESEIYKTGDGIMRFYSPIARLYSLTSYNEGFYISLFDRRTNTSYKSHVEENGSYDNGNMYNEFKADSSFTIVSSRKLNTGVYSGILSAWFLEAHFECTLFVNDGSYPPVGNITKKMTEGVIRGRF